MRIRRAGHLPEGSRRVRRDGKEAGAGGLIWARKGREWEGQGVKAIGPEALVALGASEGDLLLAVGSDAVTSPALHAVRSALIRLLAPAPTTEHAFSGRISEPDAETGAHVFVHHPFTAPASRRRRLSGNRSCRCRAVHYDAVYNGTELGSGSIRITNDVQRTIFGLLGICPEEIRRRFGFSSTASPPARLRTAASRSASTAWPCCSRAPSRCAT